MAGRLEHATQPGMVEVPFADTGQGIAPGLEQRIFDPFFTIPAVMAARLVDTTPLEALSKGADPRRAAEGEP